MRHTATVIQCDTHGTMDVRAVLNDRGIADDGRTWHDITMATTDHPEAIIRLTMCAECWRKVTVKREAP